MKDNILENEINITEIIKEVEIQKKENIIDKINNYLDINNFEYAKRLAEELIKKEPKYKEAYLVLSDIYYEEENYKAVIDILSKGLNYINNDKDLLENKIEALTSLYKYEEAKIVINNLIKLGNADSSIYGQFGVILSMEGKYKEALEQYKKAIFLNYNDIASMINMSITYKAMYLYDDAINILERALTIKKDNNILDFDLIWDLNPKIKINIKDYIKRDTKQSLDFIFDIKRIKEEGKINGKEDLQKCLESCLSNYNIIINHNVFKSKCPKPTSIIQNNILNANNIIDIVKVLRWAQKELLYFICGVETYLIYKLSISLTEHQFKSISEEKGYIDFKDLIDNYNKSTDKKLDGKLSAVKNILAHGRLSDYDYNIIVDILDSSLSKLNLSSLYENYNKKNYDIL